MSADPARKIATYEDVLAAPEHMVAQVVDGELHLTPRPGGDHALGSTRLCSRLETRFGDDDGPDGWLLLFEPELHLGPEPQILVPDLAGWRAPRAPHIGRRTVFDTAPDWVCEVLSASTQWLDRGRKADLYAREGVGHLWFVDPVAHGMEAFALDRGRWSRIGAFTGTDARIPPFDAEPLDIPRLFRERTPAPAP